MGYFQNLNFKTTILLVFLPIISCLKLEQDEITIPIDQKIPVEDKLPQVYIETNGIAIPDEPKIKAEILIENKGEKNYEGLIGIEIRGQSSQMFPKKQYGFETRN